MNKMYSFSVILPVFNGEKTIARAIDSVINQTFHNWELIVVDDGSHDCTKNIVYRYCNVHPNIHYVYEDNSGTYKARCKGITLCRNEYILFLDSDDFFQNDLMQTLIDYYNKYPKLDVIQYGVVFLTYDGIKDYTEKTKEICFTRSDFLKKTLNEGQLYNGLWNKCYKKTLLSAVAINNDFVKIRYAEDILLTAILLSKANMIMEIKKPLYCYSRINDNSITNTLNSNDCYSEIMVFSFLENYYRVYEFENEYIGFYNRFLNSIFNFISYAIKEHKKISYILDIVRNNTIINTNLLKNDSSWNDSLGRKIKRKMYANRLFVVLLMSSHLKIIITKTKQLFSNY